MICKIKTRRELRAFLNSILNDKLLNTCAYEWEDEMLDDILQDVMTDDIRSELNKAFNIRADAEGKLKAGECIPKAVADVIRRTALDSVLQMDKKVFPVLVHYTTNLFVDPPYTIHVLSEEYCVSPEALSSCLKEELAIYGTAN